VLPAAAADYSKVAITQRGQRDTAITERGQRSGFFARRGINGGNNPYTQGGPEAHRAAISGSMDVTFAGESAVGAYAKGAPASPAAP
jgi:hypothetical protein